nr:uncharacterized protein LOC117278221 [Nicotiana tomentosiformis]
MDGEHAYMGWYRSITRLFVGNPIHRAGGRFVPYAARHEALVIGLHLFHQLGLQMQQHTGEGAAALHDYGWLVTDLAARTLQRAWDDERLGYEADYMAPEQYHHGPAVQLARGRRGRGVPSRDAEYLSQDLVTAGLTTPSTESASLTDDHDAAHPLIKRRRDEDDPDSVVGRDGMRLRPAAALKHKGCGTH